MAREEPEGESVVRRGLLRILSLVYSTFLREGCPLPLFLSAGEPLEELRQECHKADGEKDAEW